MEHASRSDEPAMEWSQPIDLYCERTTAAFWAEPFNAVTNVAFVLAAFAAWRLWRRAGKGDLFVLVLIVLAAVIGLGSFAFHTLATRGAVLLDVIPIALFVHAYLLFALIRFMRWRTLTAATVVLGFFVASQALSRALPAGFLNRSGDYLPPLLALIIVGAALYARREDAPSCWRPACSRCRSPFAPSTWPSATRFRSAPISSGTCSTPW